jgi:heme/copper-type cytochrome/quinol oxidase subunit 2
MELVVFIVIFFAGSLGARVINLLSRRVLIMNQRRAGLVVVLAAATAWWLALQHAAPADASARQAGKLFGEHVVFPVLVILAGVLVADWWQRLCLNAGTPSVAPQADPAAGLTRKETIGAVALCFIVACVGAFGFQAWRAIQQADDYARAGFPDAESYRAYMAEWSKVSSHPEYQAWASKLPPGEAYTASARLTADGLPRLTAEDLIEREKIYVSIMQNQDSAFCAQLVVGLPPGISNDDFARKLISAIYQSGGENAMAAWGNFSARAALASLRNDPKPQFSDEETKTIMASLLRPLSTKERRQIVMLLNEPSLLQDRQKCDAGLNLYKSALALPQGQREPAARLLMAD